MANTQLRLDFSIETAAERKQFLDEYLDKNKDVHWSNSDIQTMGNYVLWGKEGCTTAAEQGNIELETKHKTWRKKEDESLDALMEQPTFNEASVFVDVPTKVSRVVFSRQDALRDAPDHLKLVFKKLFRQIDELDLKLNYYDLKIGKRTKEPRKELLERFTEDECEKIKVEAQLLSQYQYLKCRHLLVELRRQQFTLKDSYTSQIQRATFPTIDLYSAEPEFENTIPVFPLGIATPNTLMELIFKPEEELNPNNYTKEELETVSNFLWDKKKEEEKNNFKTYFDFRDEKHLGELFQLYLDLSNNEDNELTTALIKTVDYYKNFSRLTNLQEDILQMKINKKTNDNIRTYVNTTYGKHYAANYISTIFRQKIIPALIGGVNYHLQIIENLFFEEEFKKCIECGRLLLVNEHNFMHRTRSKDGFSNRCKLCEKKRRDRRKNEE